MKKDLEDLKSDCEFQLIENELDLKNSHDYEKYDNEKMRIAKAKNEYRKAINKTYLKGQRGKRLYYDYEKRFASDEDNDNYSYCDLNEPEVQNLERKIKCIFTKDTRRTSLFNYFKYLNGKKVLVRDLAWKFAVTERTIQHDLRFLEKNEFIVTQTNKTFKGKQTKNSYIVNLNKQSDLPFENTYLSVCFIAKKDGEYYILTKSNYKPQEECTRKFKPMQECNFSLPQIKLNLETRLDEKSLSMANKLFNYEVGNNYKGFVYSGYYTKNILHIDWDSYDEFGNPPRIIEHRKTRVVYSWFLLDTLLIPTNGYMWITLNSSNRKIKHTLTNKCLKIIKSLLG